MPEWRPAPKPKRHKKNRIGKQRRQQVDDARPDVLERDGHRCIVQGSPVGQEWPCGPGLTMQHAVNRRGPEDDAPELLRAMCGFHNVLATHDAGFARICEVNGWAIRHATIDRVRRGDLSLADIPVRYPDGNDYILGPGLAKTTISRGAAQALRLDLYGVAVA